jgi:hypothetical protein
LLHGLCDFGEVEPGTTNSASPTLRREREEWGTHSLGCVRDIRAGPRRQFKRGGPPANYPISVTLASSHYACAGPACLLNAIPDQEHTVYVIGNYPYPGAGQELAFSSSSSLVYYFGLMEGAQEALGQPNGSGWTDFSPPYPPPVNLLQVMGTAIGNAAAHEIGHQLEQITNIQSNIQLGIPGFPLMLAVSETRIPGTGSFRLIVRIAMTLYTGSTTPTDCHTIRPFLMTSAACSFTGFLVVRKGSRCSPQSIGVQVSFVGFRIMPRR